MKTIPNIAMYVLFVLTCTVAHAHPVAPIHYMKIYLIDNNMISTHYSVQLTLLSIDPCVCERNGGRELQATRGGGVGRGAWGVGRGASGTYCLRAVSQSTAVVAAAQLDHDASRSAVTSSAETINGITGRQR